MLVVPLLVDVVRLLVMVVPLLVLVVPPLVFVVPPLVLPPGPPGPPTTLKMVKIALLPVMFVKVSFQPTKEYPACSGTLGSTAAPPASTYCVLSTLKSMVSKNSTLYLPSTIVSVEYPCATNIVSSVILSLLTSVPFAARHPV